LKKNQRKNKKNPLTIVIMGINHDIKPNTLSAKIALAEAGLGKTWYILSRTSIPVDIETLV
jgi:hypothetical protein